MILAFDLMDFCGILFYDMLVVIAIEVLMIQLAMKTHTMDPVFHMKIVATGDR